MGFLQPALYCDPQVSRPFHKYADVLQTVAHALKRAASALQPTLVLRPSETRCPTSLTSIVWYSDLSSLRIGLIGLRVFGVDHIGSIRFFNGLIVAGDVRETNVAFVRG
jgi:hypothetical protein